MNLDYILRFWEHIYHLVDTDDKQEVTSHIMDKFVLFTGTALDDWIFSNPKSIKNFEYEEKDAYLKFMDVARLNLQACIALLVSTKPYKDKLYNREKLVAKSKELAHEKYGEIKGDKLLALKI